MSTPRKSFKEICKNMSWVWFVVVMSTGVISGLASSFPFGQGQLWIKIIALIFFFLNLLIFIALCIGTSLRYIWFPEVWKQQLAHPAMSMFFGAFPMGAATLINSALVCYTAYGFGNIGYVYFLWALWWVDTIISYGSAFGILYVMIMTHSHALERLTLVWLLPFVPLIVSSSTGLLIAQALRVHNSHIALITTGIATATNLMGLMFSLAIIFTFLIRLICFGTPDAMLILSGFIALGPMGQGGVSLLLSGNLLAELLPLHVGAAFPFSQDAGQLLYSVCLASAFCLWAMGWAWLIINLMSVWGLTRTAKIPFAVTWWGLGFPNGVWVLLTCQLGKALDSPFFRYLGAIECVIMLLLWLFLFVKTVPLVISTAIFKAPYLKAPAPPTPPSPVAEKDTSTTASLATAV